MLSTVPNLYENINPLKCLIKGIDCIYSRNEDYSRRNLNDYFSSINNFIKSDKSKKILFFNSYEIICPDNICYAYKKDKDILTHRDNSHLTIEGSLLLEKDFFKFYKKNY